VPEPHHIGKGAEDVTLYGFGFDGSGCNTTDYDQFNSYLQQ
jgi:hypothetical protein